MINQSNSNKSNKLIFFAHHGVLNESSVTTKLRVVFDGSSKTTTVISLNNILKVGPTVQDDLVDILLRFRLYNIVVTADIAKMYRQVIVQENYGDLQRILWGFNSNDDLCQYALNTVTYGTASASFLATRCLHQISIDLQHSKPYLSKVIASSFYVDDLIAGSKTINEAIMLPNDLSHELLKYGFPLRKWSSNEPSVLQAIAKEQSKNDGYFIVDDEVRKTLGIFWQPNTDSLEYIVRTEARDSLPLTKRSILSVISKIFDPLGLVGPVIICAKVFLQKLWLLGLQWDESVPLDVHTSFIQFYEGLKTLNKIFISRQVSLKTATSFQIHGFCDASETS